MYTTQPIAAPTQPIATPTQPIATTTQVPPTAPAAAVSKGMLHCITVQVIYIIV